MIIYTIVMFAAAALFAALAVLIYKGKTQLIHDYHQTNVTDQKGYGKAFGKAMAVIAGAMALSGAVSLFGESAMGIAVTVLMIGLIAGFIAIFRVQKKYNGGMF